MLLEGEHSDAHRTLNCVDIIRMSVSLQQRRRRSYNEMRKRRPHVYLPDHKKTLTSLFRDLPQNIKHNNSSS